MKKFGTITGVFTPSILTILGVIMYMRLGWVVGNAGLWGTIFIILMAHLISITTGLSISSIATDKKVGAGGVYYVLSRSLGLPIGGAIGITLFLGTALSIALYIVGFSENFNAFFNLSNTINGIRVSGTIALLILTSIAFISTAVALKTQYFILAAIVISLVSIFFCGVGTPEHVVGSFGDGTISFETIFAIFFPAVTGFTAGIAMSGDLKNPKKSIPLGTMASIGVGLVVYIGLAVFISFKIDAAELKSDYNILMKIALWAPAVAIGIWGATLSSALGGILGGSRILQAMSVDKITPKIFGKGVGAGNEPRNALILAVIIAEGGILIGKLDMIARVVSMFYLAAYGFINLSFFLEKWASSDFNPTFKVRKWVGFVGFLATFGVMFKLDMLAMFASFIVIGCIYLYLVKKQISLGSGDVWRGVWSSVVKNGLKKIETASKSDNQWSPNILLFSGDSEKRPHLIEFSKALAGRVGLVTNFNLIENNDSELLFPKQKQVIKDEVLKKFGVFGRQQTVKELYSGIETIASTFGFSGVEPNTVVLGWGLNARNPKRMNQLTKHLVQLDYNVLYLDYDKECGFGAYKNIDIWWRNISTNTELTLLITFFLLNSEEWRRANVRLFLVIENNKKGLDKILENKLLEHRINAKVRIINNSLEKKPFYEIIKIMSPKSDLIITGLPAFEEEEDSFVNKTNDFLSVLGTTLFVKSSKQISGDIEFSDEETIISHNIKINEQLTTPSINIPNYEPASTLTNEIYSLLTEYSKHTSSHFIKTLYNEVQVTAELICNDAHTVLAGMKSERISVAQAEKQFLVACINRFNVYKNKSISEISLSLNQFNNDFFTLVKEMPFRIPETITRKFTKDILTANKDDSPEEQKQKQHLLFWKKFGFYKKLKIQSRHVITQLSFTQYASVGFETSNQYEINGFLLQNMLKDLVIDNLSVIEKFNENPDSTESAVNSLLRKLNEKINQLYNNQYSILLAGAVNLSNSFASQMSAFKTLSNNIDSVKQQYSKKRKQLAVRSENYELNQNYYFDLIDLNLRLKDLVLSVEKSGATIKSSVANTMYINVKNTLSETKKILTSIVKSSKSKLLLELLPTFDTDELLQLDEITINSAIIAIQSLSQTLPEKIITFAEDPFQREQQNTLPPIISVDVNFICDFIIDNSLHVPLEKILQDISTDCRQIIDKAANQIKLIVFSIQTETIDEKAKASLVKLIVDTVSNLDVALNKIDNNLVRWEHEIDNVIVEAIGRLNGKFLIEQHEQLLASAKKQKRTKGVLNWWNHAVNSIGLGTQNIIAGWKNKKEAFYLAEFHIRNKRHQNIHSKLRAFVESVTPSENILQNLPYYYKQLFVGKHAPKLDFLVNRENEFKKAQNAVQKINNGVSGGLLIVGPALSGRTFLAETIAREIIGTHMYKIVTPVSGSVHIRVLERIMQNQLKSTLPLQEIIHVAKPGSLFFFDDIELWWERSSGGDVVIKQLLQLIDTYSEKYVFMMSCNVHAFQIIKQQHYFHNYFIETIHLTPFSKSKLTQTALSRHKTGGLVAKDVDTKLVLTDKQLRKTTEKIVSLADGNIGVALHLWLGNIGMVENDTIFIDQLRKIHIRSIDKKEWLVYIAQFVIHKNLTIQRIQRIFKLKSINEAQLIVKNLKRSGIIEKIIGHTYRINPYVFGLVIKQLKEYKLI